MQTTPCDARGLGPLLHLDRPATGPWAGAALRVPEIRGSPHTRGLLPLPLCRAHRQRSQRGPVRAGFEAEKAEALGDQVRATPPSRTRTGVGERKTPRRGQRGGAVPSRGGTTSLTVLVPRKAGTSCFAAHEGKPPQVQRALPSSRCRCRPLPARPPWLLAPPRLAPLTLAPRSHQRPGSVAEAAWPCPGPRRRPREPRTDSAERTSMALFKKKKQEKTRAFVVRGFSSCENS